MGHDQRLQLHLKSEWLHEVINHFARQSPAMRWQPLRGMGEIVVAVEGSSI
jgi:hypothetical protein